MVGSLKNLVHRWLKSSGPRQQAPRRARLYAVGTGKSGTHSLAEMFAGNVRAQHEPQADLLIQKVLAFHTARISRNEFAGWVRKRDRELNLEVDSSQLNFYLIDILLEEYPDARFVLTIRDCYSWLNSLLNHIMSQPQASPEWQQLRDVRCRAMEFSHAPQEVWLRARGLHTLDGYLSSWAVHNQTVVDRVPAERLLIIRTHEIRARADEIARFAGLPLGSVSHEHSHAFKNSNKKDLIAEIDRDFLEKKVDQHCRPLLRRFFPEIKSLADARL